MALDKVMISIENTCHVVGREITDELQAILLEALRLKEALHEQAGYAQKTAMSAMVSMGELGVVLQFLSKSFACATADELAAAVLEAMQQYDLQAAVQFRLGDDVLSVSQNGVNLPLEVSVLNHVQHSGRIFSLQIALRFQLRAGHLDAGTTAPVDDADRCGRIRDNGALLAEGAEARLRAIELEILTQRRRSGIESALPRLHDTLDAVQSNYRRNCFSLTQVMIEFQEALMKSCTSA